MNSLICILQCDNITSVQDLQNVARDYSGCNSFWSMDSEYIEICTEDNSEPDRKYRIELPGGMMLIHTTAGIPPCQVENSDAKFYISDEYVLLPNGKTKSSFDLSDDDVFIDRIETFIFKNGKIEYGISAFDMMTHILPLPFIKYCLERKLSLKTRLGTTVSPVPKMIANNDIWNQGQAEPTLVIFDSDGVNAYKVASDLVGLITPVIVEDPFDTEHRQTIADSAGKKASKVVRGFNVEGLVAYDLASRSDDLFCGPVSLLEPYKVSNIALFYKKAIFGPFFFRDSDLENRIAYALLGSLHDLGYGAVSHTKFSEHLKSIGYTKIDFNRISENARIQSVYAENKRLKEQLAELKASEKAPVSNAADSGLDVLKAELEAAEDMLKEQSELAENYKAQVDILTSKLEVAEHKALTLSDNFFEQQLTELNKSAIFQNEVIYVLNQILKEEQTRLNGVPDNTRRKRIVSDLLQVLDTYGVPEGAPKQIENGLMTLIPKLSGTLTPGNIQALNRLGYEVELNGDNHYKLWFKGYPEYAVSISGTTKNPVGRATSAKKLISLLFK